MRWFSFPLLVYVISNSPIIKLTFYEYEGEILWLKQLQISPNWLELQKHSLSLLKRRICSDKTKLKIEGIIQETNFSPNTFAQSLKAKQQI